MRYSMKSQWLNSRIQSESAKWNNIMPTMENPTEKEHSFNQKEEKKDDNDDDNKTSTIWRFGV